MQRENEVIDSRIAILKCSSVFPQSQGNKKKKENDGLYNSDSFKRNGYVFLTEENSKINSKHNVFHRALYKKHQ